MSDPHISNLKKERQSSLHKQPFVNLIYDAAFQKKLTFLLSLINKNITPKHPHKLFWWIHNEERYLHACSLAEDVVKLIKAHGLIDDNEFIAALQLMVGEDFFILLHLTMFLPTLQSLASDEQQAEWLTAAKEFRILGTYAQTELGHGSYVQGLETTADLDLETDEWVLNTPTLTSTKWWPGGLAKSCTHCTVMARLRIRGKDYGVHPFFLQVRDLSTHRSLCGVHLMHIGQKLGYNGMDNGGMQLRDVRIPRTNLLMRFYDVDEAGNYKTLGNKKLLYGTMTFTRKQIIWSAGIHLAKSVVIAIRYSITRRQFPSALLVEKRMTEEQPMLPPESPVLDYSTQQLMLFPLLSTSIAFTACGRWMNEVYNQFMDEAQHDNFDRLDEVHCLTSTLKAAMTMIVLDGLETARKSCGGHGYLLAAGLPLHLASYLPQATYEGDFVVLSIQAGRSLLKVVERKMQQKPLPNLSTNSMKYIYEFDPLDETSTLLSKEDSPATLLNEEWLLKAFQRRSSVLIYNCAEAYANQMEEHHDMLKALEFVKIDFTSITKAHAHTVILHQFQNRLQQFYRSNTREYNEVGRALHDLYALYWMYESFGEFVSTGVLLDYHYNMIRDAIKELLKCIRPHALTVADSFSLPDSLLNSALGEYDGNVYETLFNAAKDEPLNKKDVTDGYYQHIQYILHPERKDASRARL